MRLKTGPVLMQVRSLTRCGGRPDGVLFIRRELTRRRMVCCEFDALIKVSGLMEIIYILVSFSISLTSQRDTVHCTDAMGVISALRDQARKCSRRGQSRSDGNRD
jgi:hypothetical protein